MGIGDLPAKADPLMVTVAVDPQRSRSWQALRRPGAHPAGRTRTAGSAWIRAASLLVGRQQGDELVGGYRPEALVLAHIQDIEVLADNVLRPTLDGALEELVVVRPAA